jgi:predicted SprT family Zn-dependent metalloprotease
MFQDRCNQIKAKVNQLIAEYEHRHPGQKVPQIDIRFDLRGRSAGQASARGWNYFMRFNRDMILNAGWDHLLNDTVPHELAHIICFANGSDRGHGYNWKRTCRELGGSGERCHSEAVVYAKGRTFVYTTSTGTTVNLSETKHRKIQQGAAYTFKDRSRGRLDRTCSYSVLGTTTVVQPTKAVPVQTLLPKPAQQQPAHRGSKAELVRQIIREVRSQQGTTADAQRRAVAELGLTASYARNCVTFNWGRV